MIPSPVGGALARSGNDNYRRSLRSKYNDRDEDIPNRLVDHFAEELILRVGKDITGNKKARKNRQ